MQHAMNYPTPAPGAVVTCAAPLKPQRYTVEVRDISTRLQRWMVIDGRIQMDVYHWCGTLGEEQCNAVATALNEVNDRHPETW